MFITALRKTIEGNEGLPVPFRRRAEPGLAQLAWPEQQQELPLPQPRVFLPAAAGNVPAVRRCGGVEALLGAGVRTPSPGGRGGGGRRWGRWALNELLECGRAAQLVPLVTGVSLLRVKRPRAAPGVSAAEEILRDVN